MENKDIRWIQRFENFKKSLAKLSEAMDEYNGDDMSDTEQAGMIKFFETTYELAWLTLKDFYESKGETNIQGSRDAIRLAFSRNLIASGELWMKMIDDRKLTVHTYDEKTANEVAKKIAELYFPLFMQLQTRLSVEQLGS